MFVNNQPQQPAGCRLGRMAIKRYFRGIRRSRNRRRNREKNSPYSAAGLQDVVVVYTQTTTMIDPHRQLRAELDSLRQQVQEEPNSQPPSRAPAPAPYYAFLLTCARVSVSVLCCRQHDLFIIVPPRSITFLPSCSSASALLPLFLAVCLPLFTLSLSQHFLLPLLLLLSISLSSSSRSSHESWTPRVGDLVFAG